MTSIQFIARYRHELMGMILDAALTRRSGAALSMSLEVIGERVDEVLAAIWQEFQPEPPKVVPNGPPRPVPRPVGK